MKVFQLKKKTRTLTRHKENGSREELKKSSIVEIYKNPGKKKTSQEEEEVEALGRSRWREGT